MRFKSCIFIYEVQKKTTQQFSYEKGYNIDGDFKT